MDLAWIEQAMKSGASLHIHMGFAQCFETSLKWPFGDKIKALGDKLETSLMNLNRKAGEDAASDLLKAGGA